MVRAAGDYHVEETDPIHLMFQHQNKTLINKTSDSKHKAKADHKKD